jgi:predicted nucleic acid-binding protein
LIHYRQDVEDLLAGEFLVLGIGEADFAKAIELQRLHGLLTNDSLHLAAGLRAGVNLLVTADLQFDTVAGITAFRPDDL